MKSAYGRGTPSWGMEEKEPLHKRGHIVELYSEYIDSMGFGNETESRQRVVDVVNNFLNLVGTPSKFITDDFLDIFTSCIEGSFPSSISASELVGVAEAFCLLEDFILRLVTEPWRPDSRSLKLYNSFFVNSVLPFVPEAAKIFTLLGYVSQPNNLLVLPPAAAIDSAAASAVSCDLLIAACETRILLAVYDLLRGSGGSGSGGVSVEDVWKERKISVCSVDSCAKLISAKRRLKSASPTPSSSSFKPPANPSSTPPDFPVPHFGVTSSGSVSRRHPVNSLTRRSPLRSSLPSAKPTSGLSAEATTPASASSPSRSVASMHRLSLRDEARPLAKPASASRPISAEGLHQNELNASLTVTSLEATPNASSFGRGGAGGAGGGFGSGRLLADSLTDDNDAEFASTKFYPSDEVNRRSFYDNDGFDALASQQQQQHHHGSPATQLENGFTNSSSSSHHPQQHHHHHQLQQQQQQKPFTLSSFAAPDSSASFRLGAKVDLPLSGALSSASSDVPISVSSNSYRDSSSSAAAAAAAKIPDWPRDKSLAVSSSGVVSTGSSSSSSKASSSHRVVKIPIHVVSSNQKPKAFVTTKLGVSPSSAPSAANANARPSAAVQIPVRRETPPQSSPLTQRANHVVNVLSDDGGGDASYDEEDDEDYDDEEFDDGAGKFQRRSPTRDSYRNAIQAGGAAPPGASGLDLLDAYAAMSLSDFADSHGISQTSTLPISGLRSKNSDVSQRSLPVVYRNSLKKATKRPDPSHHSLQPRSDVERRWTCSSCTYSNSNSLAVCEMCHRSKGSARKTNLKSGGHQCPQCTLVNDKGVMTCNACGHNLEGCPTYI